MKDNTVIIVYFICGTIVIITLCIGMMKSEANSGSECAKACGIHNVISCEAQNEKMIHVECSK